MTESVNQPNLLYIHSDQHAAAVAGCYGDQLVHTPNLDQLAAEGIVLDNVYCPSPICTPSRMSMFSGRFPYENQVWTNYHTLDSGIPTLAHAMGAAGYQPILFGRMHSIGPDQLRGYTERYVGDHCSNYTESSDIDHGELQGTQGPKRISLIKSGAGQNAYQVHDEDVVEETVAYINKLGQERRELSQARKPLTPFCLTVGLMLPHQPFVARKEDYQLYQGQIKLPKIRQPFSDQLHPFIYSWRKEAGIVSVTEAEILRARTAYWALVTRMDKLIGQILDVLRKNNLDQNTLIIYMSDHGEQVGEHDLWWKQTFYEHSVKVPAILCWPGQLPKGKRFSQVISSLDLNATLLDALSAPPLPNSRGRSLLPLIQSGQTANWQNVAFSEFCTHDNHQHRMIRQDEWKLNYYHGQPVQLFNLVNDPDELNDLADQTQYADIQRQLIDRILDGWEPNQIAEIIKRKRADYNIISNWAKKTKPTDHYRWQLRPEMDYLD